MRILRVLRVVKLSKFVQKVIKFIIKFEETINSDFFQISGSVIKLLFAMLLFAHWGACFLFYIGVNECIQNGVCWLLKDFLIDAPKYDQYIASFYFFITTMTTLGFGDFRPVSLNERLYQVFCMLLSCAMFAYIIGSMGKILSVNYDTEALFKEKIMTINKHLVDKEVDEPLRVKIKTFLEHKLETKMEEKLDASEVLDLINKNLKEEIIYEINKKLLNNFKYFNDFERICIKITKIIKDETMSKNELIFEVNNIKLSHTYLLINYLLIII